MQLATLFLARAKFEPRKQFKCAMRIISSIKPGLHYGIQAIMLVSSDFHEPTFCFFGMSDEETGLLAYDQNNVKKMELLNRLKCSQGRHFSTLTYFQILNRKLQYLRETAK